MFTATAVEIVVTDQPNSACSGSISTPGTARKPAAPSSARNVTAAAHQAGWTARRRRSGSLTLSSMLHRATVTKAERDGAVRRTVDGHAHRTMLVRATAPRDPPPVDDNAISIRGLVKRYAGTARPAVDRLDLDVRRGEVVALLGPNGAGKTTTVEILEGYRERDAGEVSVLGSDPGRTGPAWRARIGIVPQGAADMAELRPVEVVHHIAAYYPDPRDPDEVLRLTGLWEQRRTLIRNLSGGQRRRLDVALGVVGRPELLFLDEPSTGLDPQARRDFSGLVTALTGEGTTILLTTHYLDEAEVLADRVAVMVGGRIVAEGPPAALGDRDSSRATVRWRDQGVMHEERTHSPTALVAQLAARCGGEVAGLTVARPTLEDVYVDLVEAGGAR